MALIVEHVSFAIQLMYGPPVWHSLVTVIDNHAIWLFDIFDIGEVKNEREKDG